MTTSPVAVTVPPVRWADAAPRSSASALPPSPQPFDRALDRAHGQRRPRSTALTRPDASPGGDKKGQSPEPSSCDHPSPQPDASAAAQLPPQDAPSEPAYAQPCGQDAQQALLPPADQATAPLALAPQPSQPAGEPVIIPTLEKTANIHGPVPAAELAWPLEPAPVPQLLAGGSLPGSDQRPAVLACGLPSANQGSDEPSQPSVARAIDALTASEAPPAGKGPAFAVAMASSPLPAEAPANATIARPPAEMIGPGQVIGPPHPSASAPPDNVARVAKGLYAAASAGGGAVTLRLSPPELGIVRVELQMQHGLVRAKLLAEQDSARDLLSHRVGELRLALERQGLVVERLQVEALSNHAPTPQGPPGEQDPRDQRGGQAWQPPQQRQDRREPSEQSFESELLNMVA